MKKYLYVFAVIVCIAIAFTAGYSFKPGPGDSPIRNAVSRVQSGGADETGTQIDEGDLPPGAVRIGFAKQQKMGVRTAPVETGRGEWRLRAPGRVVPDETRVYRTVTATEGWIRSISKVTTGSVVQKNEVLAIFYSPEFLSAQQAYIYALGSLSRFKASGKETGQQINLTELNVQQYKDTLRNIGMSDIQIEEIGRTRQYTENVEIRAPASGFVTVRNVSPGQRMEKGSEIFRIVDLRQVWVLADIYEDEARYLKPGSSAAVTSPRLKKTFQARVSAVLPQFDPVTRTLKARLEILNPGFVLRPDMFVDVEFSAALPQSVVVPVDAVLDSGLRKTVFIERGNGIFQPREVETGRRFGNRIEIVKGLDPGERIVVSGNFLIDSESRMELALNGMAESTARDPVSGKKLSVKKAEQAGMTIAWRDKTYYFSSEANRQKFAREPDRYLSRFGE